MKKEQFNFDKLMDVINYYDVQKDFLNVGEDGNFENFDFDSLFERGIFEDDFPDNFKEFDDLGIGIDKIVMWGTDHDSEPVTYWFDKVEECISIYTDKFTLKEAITIINLVMEHQRLNNGWCHNVSFGRNIDDVCIVYGQESTAFGCWWNDFLDFFEKNMTNIESIDICLGMTKDRSIDIMFWMKK